MKDKNGKEYFYIEFKGKKGVLNSCRVYDSMLIKELKSLLKYRKEDEYVFLWNKNGVNVPVRAIDINIWLQTFDKVITSKDFRTYTANIFFIIFMRKQRIPSKLTTTERKKKIVAAMKEISSMIHNTPAILKKNYTASGMLQMYMEEPYKFEKFFIEGDKSPKKALVDYLKIYCKDF